MRILIIITLLLLTQKSFAQSVNGQIVDYLTKFPVENAIVIYGNQTLITSSSGKFSFIKKPSNQIVQVKKLGFEDYQFDLKNHFKDIIIYLKPSSINLNDVLVLSKRNYITDSIKLREDYATIFAYKAPTIKDVLVKKGLRYPTFGSNLVSNSTSSIISFDLLQTLSLLTKNKSSISKLQKVQLQQEETNYINHRFDKENIKQITQLDGDSLLNFIETYRPSPTEIKKMNDYQILLYIKKSYNEFIKPKKD